MRCWRFARPELFAIEVLTLDDRAANGQRLEIEDDRAESPDADIEMTRRKAFPAILRLRDRGCGKTD
jgi:hypothetical protein